MRPRQTLRRIHERPVPTDPPDPPSATVAGPAYPLPKDAAILTQLINFCWSLFQWALLLVIVAALVIAGYLYLRLDDEIRRHVEQKLASHYHHLEIHIGSARFEKDRGITIYQFSALEPQRGTTPQPLVTIDELFLACTAGVEELMTGEPPIDRIHIRRCRLRAIRQADGSWNFKALLPLPKFSNQTPTLSIEDATLIVEDAGRKSSQPLVLRGIDATLTPLAAPAGLAGRETLAARFDVAGTVTGFAARELTLCGTVGLDGLLDIQIDAVGLEISPELVDSCAGGLPPELQSAELHGRANGTLHLARSAGAAAPAKWRASVRLERGRLDHPLLMQPLTELEFTLEASSDGLAIERLTGKAGNSGVALAGRRNGWSADAPCALAVRATSLPLSEELFAKLPVTCTPIWQRFQPTGPADVELGLVFDGRRWQPRLTAECRGISLTDSLRFPYKLEQTFGSVVYGPATDNQQDQLTLNLTGVGAGRPVTIAVELSGIACLAACGDCDTTSNAGAPTASGAIEPSSPPPRHPLGWIEISGSDIPLHEQLVVAMSDDAEMLLRSLSPQGIVDFRWRIEWTDPQQPLANTTAEIQLKDCAVQYEQFNYPLQRINGRIVGRNRHWVFHDLVSQGENRLARIVCRGELQPTEAGPRLDVVLQATGLPLDENLRRALSPVAQQAWGEIRPQGRVNVTALVVRQPGEVAPSVDVTVEPYEQSVSIEPVSFPYRLEQIAGRATLSDGTIRFQSLQAQHGRAGYSARGGQWQAAPDGGWQLALEGVNADYLTAQRDLLIALPPRLQKTIERLQPSGTFAIYDSAVSFTKRPDVDRLAAAWDVHLGCHQATFHGGVPLENASGSVRLVGRDDSEASYIHGELEIDSVIWNNLQFTNVRGPLWADAYVCLLGQPAATKLAQPPRRITADAYGGSLAADVSLAHDGHPRYKLDLAVGAVDVARFVTERSGGPLRISGRASGRLSLEGTGRSTHALNGSGELHLVDANIYELPVLVALLKVLRNRTPNTTAFNQCDMQFTIQGEHVHFQQLNLLGDAVSLYGRGQTDFDGKLDLAFYTLMGPADLPIPLWKTIAGQVSEQGLQLKVAGTMEHPEIQRQVLPAVDKVLQQLQSEVQAGAATIVPPAAFRGDSTRR